MKITLSLILFILSLCSAQGAEAVYRIVEYNKSTDEFKLAAAGLVPQNSWAYFQNAYGATTGNRYNQIPRNQKATFTLEGWQGCTIHSITLSLCSNNKSGQLGWSIADGETTLYYERPTDFGSSTWFGDWVSKDFNVFVDITRTLTTPTPLTTDNCTITLQGGTAEGSVYVDAITINYDAPQNVTLTSPLGYIYEKLTAKSTLNEGDELMIYRNGCAAADIDGIATGHYLDAVAVASTTDVSNPDILNFTLGKLEEDSPLWTLTNQYGQALTANAKQSLTWNEGDPLWNITLGYGGATITNATEGYGTLRFNAPTNSYARFALYTSKSLHLPYLYKKVGQNRPIPCTNIAFETTDLTASIDEGHVALHPSLSPSNATDHRLRWTTSDPTIATVNGGYVTLHGIGKVLITVTSCDGSNATATIRLTITGSTSSINLPTATTPRKANYKKQIKNNQIFITNGTKSYNIIGQQQ